MLQNFLISRALCWRLSLAAGASVQARRASSELRSRAKASDRLEKLSIENTENLKRMRALFEAARKEAFGQKQKVEELQALLAKTDDACLELARVKSKHAEEVGAIRRQHGETLNRLRREADAERSRLSGMLGEVEEKLKRRDRDVADMSANIQRQQGQIKQLSDELSQTRGEVNDRQARINALKERVDMVRADKLRAIDEAKGLSAKLAQMEGEMAKLELDSQVQTRALQGELQSSRTTNTELEVRVGELRDQVVVLQGQVAEAEERVALLRGQVAEVEMRFGMLKGEQDATCAEAYDLGAEECRGAISKEHPEWDLSFLDARSPTGSASLDEGEDEYIDDSDTDLGAASGPGEAADPGECPQVASTGAKAFEAGESSRAPEGAAEDSAGADPTSDL